MNNFKKSIIVLSCLFLSGCTFYSYSDRQKNNEIISSLVFPENEEQALEPLVQPLEQTSYYMYEQLDEENRIIYEELYDSMACMEEEIIISTNDETLLKHIFDLVMLDHPEIFYVNGYQYTRYYVGEQVTKIGFIGNYNMTRDEVEKNWKIINEVTDVVMTQMSDIEDEYYKAKYIYDYLIDETEYELDSDNNQNICSVFINKVSVCQGYAKAYEFLLQKAGMISTLVSGIANDEGHVWNLVYVNGNFYYADATWGDASYIISEDLIKAVDKDGFDYGVNYDYFLVNYEDIVKTHSFDEVELYPECNTIMDNYYIREKLYLEKWDYDQVKVMLNTAHDLKKGNVTIKCSTEDVFTIIKNELITKKKVFDMLDFDENGIAYAFDESQLTFTIWF